MNSVKRPRSLFIAGTDTGVGKTIVTAGLAAHWRGQGAGCGVMKPVQSGAALEDPQSDAAYLKRISGISDALTEINVASFLAPLAPALAAQWEGKSVSLAEIKSAYEVLSRRHDYLLVEGAGGLFVPLNSEYLILDLIVELQLPVLLVGRIGLGTVNHCLTSLECLQRRGIEVAGVVLNTTTASVDISAKDNPELLQKWTGVPVWGVVDFISDCEDREEVVAKLASMLKIN